MKRVWSMLTAAVCAALFFHVHAAESPADPVMGVYEGFWKASDGTRGRISAQIRPVGGGRHDGFVAFYKSKALEGVLKLKPGAGIFNGSTDRAREGMLIP